MGKAIKTDAFLPTNRLEQKMDKKSQNINLASKK